LSLLFLLLNYQFHIYSLLFFKSDYCVLIINEFFTLPTTKKNASVNSDTEMHAEAL